jgi:hypothetical protein
MPKAIKFLLGLSHKFIPVPKFTSSDIEASLERLERDIHLKVFFADEPWDNQPPPLYMKSNWRPNFRCIPREVDVRLAAFFRAVRPMFTRRRGCSNLLKFQRGLLDWLIKQNEYIIAKTDKGLGPCAVEFSRYARDVLVHLSDTQFYEIISAEEAAAFAEETYRQIMLWCSKFQLPVGMASTKYIRFHTTAHREDPHGYFYLMYKIHKTPIKTRPVCSDSGSVTYALGKWVDTQLQPMAKSMPTYFKDSFALKEILDGLQVRPGTRVFTADATAMYQYIDPEKAIPVVAEYLRDPATQQQFPDYDAEALIAALEIVLLRNTMRCGDVFVKQTSGTAMGKPCAPPWAIIFEGLHEKNILLVAYENRLPVYLRFIDDVLGFWSPNEDRLVDEQSWNGFKSELNNWYDLDWDISDRVTQVNFMDLTIKIVGSRIETTLYEKPMALYLYIPPHSAHPPGVRTGHIFGEVLRIHRLCTHQDDVDERIRVFFRRCMRRGHNASDLLPLFTQAITNARKFMTTSTAERQDKKQQKLEEARTRVYFHVDYHPQGPLARNIQQKFDEIVLNPPGKAPFRDVGQGGPVPVDAMIVANHRSLNLENLLSYRKISERNGPPISSFIEN